LSILKKAVGIGLAASLLASTMATMLPGTAFASGSVTTLGLGTVTAGTPAGPVTFGLATQGVITFSQIGDVVPGVLTVTAPTGIKIDNAYWSFSGGITGVPAAVLAPDNQSAAFTITGGNTAVGATITFDLDLYNTDGVASATPRHITTTGPFNWLPASQTIVDVTVVPAAADSLLITANDTTPLPGQVVNVTVQALDQFGNPTTVALPDSILMTQNSTVACGTGTFSGAGVWAVNASGTATGTYTVATPVNPAGCTYTLLGVLNSDLTVVGSETLTIYSPNRLRITVSDGTPIPGDTVDVNVTVLDDWIPPFPVLGADFVDLVQTTTCPLDGGFGPFLTFSETIAIDALTGQGSTTFTIPINIVGGCSYTISGSLVSNPAVVGDVTMSVQYGPISFTEATVTNTAVGTLVGGGGYVGTGEYRITESCALTARPFGCYAPDVFPVNGFEMFIRIRDANGDNTVHFDTTASSVVLSPATLGLSASFFDDSTLVVTSANSDPFIVETLIIGGLKVSADVGARVGAIQTTYALAHRSGSSSIDDPLDIDFGGKVAYESTGFLFFSVPAGFVWSFPIQLDPSSREFTATDALGQDGPLNILAGATAESQVIWGANPAFGLLQEVWTNDFLNPHAAGTRVSQDHLARNCDTPWPGSFHTLDIFCVLPSIGSVGGGLGLSTSQVPFIQRGLPNGQLAAQVFLSEQSYGQIAAGTVITLKLDPAAGVKFSTGGESSVTALAGEGRPGDSPITMANVGTSDISADRLTLTYTTRTADFENPFSYFPFPIPQTTFSQILFYNLLLDASNASAAAANVVVTVAVGSLTVVPNTATIAKLNNTSDGTALSIPTVIIGENDQLTGTVQIREAAAGTFGADPTLGSWMFVCYVDNDVLGPPNVVELFTRAPYAVVTAGDLQLRSVSDPTLPGLGVAAGTAVRGEIFFGNTNCASWFIYQYSTKASTIEIRGMGADGLILPAGPGNGPQVNVPASMTPGPSTLSLKTSPSYNSGGSQFDLVVNANRAYGATPVVAAASNPEIYRGRISQAAGDVTVTETKTYQLGTYYNGVEFIGYYIVPNSGLDITTPRIYFDSNRDKPVIETNSAATGLVASFGGFYGFCSGTQAVAFDVVVQQRAFVPITGSWVPGVLTVKNIKYSTTNEAPFGNVVLRVVGGPVFIQPAALFAVGTLAENPANFDQTVVNAHVVNPIVFPTVAIASGYKGREVSPYITFGTLIVKSGTYVTIRVNVGRQFQNLPIAFWQRNGKSGTWVQKTIGRVDANGFAFWSTRPPTLSGTGFDKYVYYRAYFAGSETLASQWSQTTVRAVARANGPFTVK